MINFATKYALFESKSKCRSIMNLINISDNHTLKRVYSEYYKALVGYSYSLLADAEDAEDVVQNVLYKSWKRNAIFESEAKLKSFLWTSVRNESLTRLRHVKIIDEHKSRIEKESGSFLLDDNGEEQLNKEELYRQLFQAIDALPGRQRDIFLQVMKGKKNAEIAESMNISINTVRSLRKKGMETLRENVKISSLLFMLILLDT